MRERVHQHFKKHYELYITISNIMIAVGTAAFAIMGVLSTYMSVPVLVTNAVIFGVMMMVGKYGNEQLEDLPKVEAMMRCEPCGSTSSPG